ncbi:hypothetical protein ACVW1C_005936 [Bradyrhizobium sp. USDA 4011]
MQREALLVDCASLEWVNVSRELKELIEHADGSCNPPYRRAPERTIKINIEQQGASRRAANVAPPTYQQPCQPTGTGGSPDNPKGLLRSPAKPTWTSPIGQVCWPRSTVNSLCFRLSLHLTTHITGASAHHLEGCHDYKEGRGSASKHRACIHPPVRSGPDFTSIVANDLASRFDRLDRVRMRVGTTPQYSFNLLNYN